MAREKATRELMDSIIKTFVEADDYLELSRGALTDTNKGNDFLTIMKMSSTIELLTNEALRVEIKTQRKSEL